MRVGSRQSRRRRGQARRNQEKMKEFAHSLARGAEWSVLVLGLMVSLVGVLVTVLAGEDLYAVLFLLFSLFVGAALWKRETA
jgi:membrane protein YqaA with SNARE-associated domain